MSTKQSFFLLITSQQNQTLVQYDGTIFIKNHKNLFIIGIFLKKAAAT